MCLKQPDTTDSFPVSDTCHDRWENDVLLLLPEAPAQAEASTLKLTWWIISFIWQKQSQKILIKKGCIVWICQITVTSKVSDYDFQKCRITLGFSAWKSHPRFFYTVFNISVPCGPLNLLWVPMWLCIFVTLHPMNGKCRKDHRQYRWWM